MSYTVFARKYRPQTFDDVVGQEHITRTLKNAIEQRRLAHAYIFVGPRGTGKTSTARILAKSLNCQAFDKPTTEPCGKCDACKEIAGGNSLDVLEFDAASNTQVDKVRELIIENVKYAPSNGRYKVYIVDEVHMLSTSSFNALLKTLEEPPDHVKFVFATTDVQKVPTTILSRCQRFDLKRIPEPLISGHLLGIAKLEGIALSQAAADTIAHGAEGGMRDAESMLDQLVAFCGNTIEEADVLMIFGLTAHETVAELAERIISGDTPGALTMVHEESEAGRDLSRLMGNLILHFRNVLVAQVEPGSLRGELSGDVVDALAEQASRVRSEKLLELIEQFAGAESRMRWAPNRKMHMEIAVIRAVQGLRQATLGEVLETLGAMRTGAPLPEVQPPVSRTLQPVLPKREAPAKPAAIAPKPPVVKAVAVDFAESPRVEERPKPVVEIPAPVVAKEAPTSVPDAGFSKSSELESERSPFDDDDVAPDADFANASSETGVDFLSAAIEAEPEPEPAADLISRWQEVIAEVRRMRPLIVGWVAAATPLSVENGTALIGFPPDQSLAAESCQQPKHRALLEEIFARIAGTPLQLKTVIKAGLESRTYNAPETKPEAPVDPMVTFKNDPLIQRALEIFRAQIQTA